MSDRRTAEEAASESAMAVLKGSEEINRENWDMREFRKLDAERQYELVEGHDGLPRHPATGRKICGAEKKSGKGGPCLDGAGAGTTHNGEGRCQHHEGASPYFGTGMGRYADVERRPTQHLIEKFNRDDAPLDVSDELAVMRALVAEYINEYEELSQALCAWNQAERSERGENARPKKIPHVDRALEMLEKVAKVAQKQQRLEQQDAVSRRQMLRIMTHMGRVVDDLVDDDEVVEQIRDEWRNMYV